MTETGRAVGSLFECPDLATLVARPFEPRVRDHVEACEACLVVVECLAHPDSSDGCAAFEPLLAARDDGGLGSAAANLLARHLASCGACRSAAGAMAPSAPSAVSLPEVDPASYALGVEIARGGMGRILAARDLRVGRPVAVKELLRRSASLAARFEREARITARLQHPGIVPIYEIGRWPDGTPFYSMRMVDGGTLRDAMASAQTLAARLALLPAVIAASEAIAFAHAQRVIHRDLTPSNVLVGAYGETVVIDWGIAKDLADADDVDAQAAGPFRETGGLTQAGTVIGTVAYMPPEQANAAPVDERADVYALGALLYHLLAGVPPYHRAANVLDAVKAGPPRPVETLAPSAPRDLVSIVSKAMQRDRADRYPSARELAEELKRFQNGRMVQAHEYTTLERMWRFVVRNRNALLITAIGVVTLAITAAVAVTRVYRERTAANRTVRTLLEERGRTELLAGNPTRAAAFLFEAYRADDDDPALRFMLAGAMREIDAIDATLDCGGDVRELALSPDGLKVAAACKDVARVWRISDGAPMLSLGPIPRAFDVIRFSHDGRTLVTGGLDGQVRLFDASTGALEGRLSHATDDVRITWVGLTPDDRKVVSTGFDGTAQVWDLATKTRLHVLPAGALGLVGVHGRLTPDGKMLVTATLGGVGTGWDVETGERLGSLDHGSQILGGEVSPDSTMACTPGVDRRVKVWDLAGRVERWTLVGHSDVVWKCVFSPDSTRLATTSNDGTAKVWDVRTGALITSVEAGDIVWSVAWSPDGRRLVTSSLDGALKIWQASTGALLASHDDPFGGKAAMFSLDGSRLIAQRGDGRIRIWHDPTGPLRAELAPAAGQTLLAASRDGTRAVMQSGWGGLELWDTATHARIAHPPIREPFALADGVLAARDEHGVIAISLGDGSVLGRLDADATGIAIAKDGSRAAIRRAGQAPAVWDVASGRVIATLDGAEGAVLSDDGRRALTSPDFTLWDVDGHHPLGKLPAHSDPRIVGFSHDGHCVALHEGLADEPRLLTVWRDDGEPVFRERITSDGASFDPSGTLVTTIGPDNVIRVRRACDGELLSQFVSEHVARVQANPTGDLVVAIDKLGSSALVLDTRDGLVLAREPIEHPPMMTTEDTFMLRAANGWWTGDRASTSIVTVSRTIAVWDAHSEARPAAQLAAIVHARVPWRVANGRLELTSVHASGRVTQGGAPVPDATVTLAIREVPHLPAAVNWTTTMSQLHQRTVSADADGRFDVPDLFPGEYAVIARSPSLHAASAPRAVGISDGDADVELDLDRRADLRGTVRDPSGRAVSGARVVAACSTQGVDDGSATTSADGSFSIGPVAGGCTYEVEVSDGGRRASAQVPVLAHGDEVTVPALVVR